MSIVNKIKNFFYEDVEEDEEVVEKEPKKKEKVIKEKKRLKEEVEQPIDTKEKKDDITERELFESERTFNFPMDFGDDIFDETVKMPIIEEEKKEEKVAYKKSSVYDTYTSTSQRFKTEEKKEETKFRPSPVVSPVYGILDKNYTVEDVVDKNLSKTKEFSLDKKTVDFDSVRNRVYKDLDDEIEKTLTKSKDIFYNLDEDSNEEENEYINNESIEEPDDDREVVITYEESDIDSVKEEPSIEVEDKNEDIEEDDDFEMPEPDVKIKRSTRKKKEETKKEEKEDLFNLIDNMYKDDDEEDEE